MITLKVVVWVDKFPPRVQHNSQGWQTDRQTGKVKQKKVKVVYGKQTISLFSSSPLRPRNEEEKVSFYSVGEWTTSELSLFATTWLSFRTGHFRRAPGITPSILITNVTWSLFILQILFQVSSTHKLIWKERRKSSNFRYFSVDWLMKQDQFWLEA